MRILIIMLKDYMNIDYYFKENEDAVLYYNKETLCRSLKTSYNNEKYTAQEAQGAAW